MAELPVSRDAVYSALPTVRVGGQEHPLVSDLLLALEMTEQEGGMSALELRLSNVATDERHDAALAFEDDRILKLGASMAVYAGDRNTPQEIFRGIVTGLEGEFAEEAAPELVVLAEDRLQSARMARRTKVWDGTSIAALARAVAARLGLTPVVTGLSDDLGPLVQLNESDLAFLRRVLARHDGDAQVVGDELHVSARSHVQRGSLDLALHGQLRSARVLADLAHQVTEVTVSGWDAAHGRRVRGRSAGGTLRPGVGRAGAQLLRDAVGDRSEHVGTIVVATQREADAVAEADFDRRARSFVSVTAIAEGNPRIRVGAQVNLSGLGGRFDNSYYVTGARHRYDLRRGYETEFEAECPFLGRGT